MNPPLNHETIEPERPREAQRGPEGPREAYIESRRERPREAQRGQWRPLISVEFIASCLWAPPVATQFSVFSQYIHTYIHIYMHVYINVSVSGSAHCIILWAPPVASQFSVVRAPPVATLVSCVHSLRHVFGHRLWRLTYIVFCSVTDFCPSSGTASGDPFVPFDLITSFLWAPPVATYIHTYIGRLGEGLGNAWGMLTYRWKGPYLFFQVFPLHLLRCHFGSRYV